MCATFRTLSIADAPFGSVKSLYISPLKALINDQFQRLEVLCEAAQIPVHRWHGDVSASEKRSLRDHPGGVLLITPESLESHCINYGPTLGRIYSCLEFVVIDELHSFLEDVRGVHLRSLLSRICQAAGCSPRLLGLSATIGDFSPAQQFLCASNPASVRILNEEGAGREVRIGLKSYVRYEEKENAGIDQQSAELAIAVDIAVRFRRFTNLIFFNSRGFAEEMADLLNEFSKVESWPTNPFVLHHGSLSKELREGTEDELKSGKAVTALCTRTLEMGIDIGAVHTVGQVGAPHSVASLVQRMGRSGRREGEAQTLRLYAVDQALSATSSATVRLYPDLLRGVAMVELLLRKWVEAPRFGRKHYSTLTHQIFSVLRQTGGIRADLLFDTLCGRGAFNNVGRSEFVSVLRNLASNGVVQQIETGEIVLAPAGEQIVQSKDFYAAFASPVEYSIECGASKIGVMPKRYLPPVGECLLLAGKRWCVVDVDDRAKRAEVAPARGKKVPIFAGGVGWVNREVMQQMQRVLISPEVPAYLHKDAAVRLGEAREHYSILHDGECDVLVVGKDVQVLPWEGTAVHQTLVACAKADGFNVEISRDELSVTYEGCTRVQVLAHLRRVAQGAFGEADLVEHVGECATEKFDGLIPVDLLALAYVRECLDLGGTMRAAEKFGRRGG